MDSSKSPFDDPDLHRKSESAASDPSSATAIFGTVSPKPAQPEDDILKSLLGKSKRSIGDSVRAALEPGNDAFYCPSARSTPIVCLS